MKRKHRLEVVAVLVAGFGWLLIHKYEDRLRFFGHSGWSSFALGLMYAAVT